MIRNYWKIAVRNILKDKKFSAINVLGLAIGLATCLLISVYVVDELSYDRYNKHYNDIYRINVDINFAGTAVSLATVADGMGPTLKREYPMVKEYVRINNIGNRLVKKDGVNIQEKRIAQADSSIFKVFSLPMVAGDPSKALVSPNSLVITESTAKKYFNSTDVLDKSMILDDSNVYKITGVIKDIPSQSHFNFDFFMAMSAQEGSRQNNWFASNYNTYVLLKEGADPAALSAHFDEITRKYVGGQLQQMMHTSLENLEKQGNYVRFSMTPLRDIHLHSNRTGELAPNGNVEYVYIFSAIAIFILMIACINFMNLSTARSAGRAKEVGVRKVLGSLRSSLIAQFIAESVVMSWMALLIAIGIAVALLPFFNQLAGREMSFGVLIHPMLLTSIVLLPFILGILAGSYPALVLSSFQPIQVLKGKLAGGFKMGWLRSVLVVFQFVISIFLIVCTLVILSQLHYIRNKDIGFDRTEVMVIKNTDILGGGARVLSERVSKLAGVNAVTMSGFLPTMDHRHQNTLYKDPGLGTSGALNMEAWPVDTAYITTLDMKIVKGRNFSAQFQTDSSGVILNEAAVRMLGFTDPIGQKLYSKDVNTNKIITYMIIGVIKDFNFNSLREVVTPAGLFLQPDMGNVAIRFRTKDVAGLIDQVKRVWSSLSPNNPFAYTFMDEEFDRIYQAEQRTEKIFIYFALLAVLIACMGLFGLSTFAVEQRSKEIGIRKVMGASTNNILSLLSRDLLKLVVIAFIIASPLSWWIMVKWLQNFAYRIDMSAWYIFIAGCIGLMIAFFTIFSQVIRAAIESPVKSLRTEG